MEEEKQNLDSNSYSPNAKVVEIAVEGRIEVEIPGVPLPVFADGERKRRGIRGFEVIELEDILDNASK